MRHPRGPRGDGAEETRLRLAVGGRREFAEDGAGQTAHRGVDRGHAVVPARQHMPGHVVAGINVHRPLGVFPDQAGQFHLAGRFFALRQASVHDGEGKVGIGVPGVCLHRSEGRLAGGCEVAPARSRVLRASRQAIVLARHSPEDLVGGGQPVQDGQRLAGAAGPVEPVGLVHRALGSGRRQKKHRNEHRREKDVFGHVRTGEGWGSGSLPGGNVNRSAPAASPDPEHFSGAIPAKIYSLRMIPLSRPGAEITLPGGGGFEAAAARVTHLGIGAHQDDLEFMAYHGILACYDREDRSFGGITCTSGSGSARQGEFAACTDDEMSAIRREEQRAAARLGKYGFMIQLDVPTSELKSAPVNPLSADLERILTVVHPRVVYTHNPADKHETHLHVFAAVIDVLRALPADRRPEQVFGCEVWRGLDWMNDDEKVAQDVSGRPELAAGLNGLFASQIAGGKRYDLATEGRRRANATYLTAHSVDQASQISYAMDLTPLVRDPSIDVLDFTLGFIDRFRSSVESALGRALRR